MSAPTKMIEHALAAARRGLKVHPCHEPTTTGAAPECSCENWGGKCTPGRNWGKHPRLGKGWQTKATTDEDQIRRWWKTWPDSNVGEVLGEGVFALDVDGEDGMAALRALVEAHGDLPETYIVSTGRGHHIYYRCAVQRTPGNKDLTDHVNVRAKAPTGGAGNLIGAGSLHYSGTRYEVIADAPIADAPEWMIAMLEAKRDGATSPKPRAKRGMFADVKTASTTAIGRYGSAALSAACDRIRSTPEGGGDGDPGGRDTVLFAEACGMGELIAAGAVKRERVEERLREAAIASGLPDDDNIPRQIGNGIEQGMLAPRDLSEIAEEASRIEIKLDPNLAKMTDAVAAALALRSDANIYQRAGLLVKLVDVKRAPGVDVNAKGILGPDGVRRPDGAPLIHVAQTAAVHETVARVCKFIKTKTKVDKKTGEEQKSTIELPAPRNIVEMFAARGSWNLPILETVAESPRMRSDGTIIQSPGLDAATGVYYRPVVDYPAVSDAPTRDEALAALEVLKYPICDFPFVAEHHRSAALAAILTVAAGPRITGPRPMFEVGASTPGEGKGKLVSVASIIGNGRPPACMASPKDEDESRKAILSLALDGTQVILLDNAAGLVGTPSLAMALTAGEIRGRVLGLSRMATVPISAAWFITGNNISYTADLARRVVPIALDAGVEHPEDRTDWHESDLIGYCMRERPRLAVAALTILRAHAVAGQPLHGGARKGSFESWDDVVRSALLWLGEADPLGGVAELREHADADRDAIAEFMDAWHDAFGEKKMAAGDVVEHSQQRLVSKLRTALVAFAGAADASRLGFKLREVKGRLVGGRRFQMAGITHGRKAWALVAAT